MLSANGHVVATALRASQSGLSRRMTLLASTQTTAMRAMSTCVLAEYDARSGALSGATLAAVTAARAAATQSQELRLLVAGDDSTAAHKAATAAASNVAGVTGVVGIRLPSPSPERVAAAVVEYVRARPNTRHLFAGSTSYAKAVAPRVAALLGSQMLSDVVRVVDDRTYVRPIYAGNALQTVRLTDAGLGAARVCIATIRATTFEKAKTGGGSASSAVAVETFDASATGGVSSVTLKRAEDEAAASTAARPEMTSARVVISGGRALKSADNFKLLERLADAFGPGQAAIGASRAAVDAGYCANDMQVGQTGKVVAPELYIAIGISGAIQHVAGMKDSKTIVSINSDAEAPIFQISDLSLVGDLFKIVPELTDKLKSK